MAISIITLVLLSLGLAWAVFSRAGVWPQDWEVSLLIVGLSAINFAIGTKRQEPGEARNASPRWLGPILFALPAYIALTLVPLPASLLALLSPERARLLQRLQPVVPSLAWAPLSVNPPATALGLFTILGCIATFFLIRAVVLRTSAKPFATAIPLLILAVCEATLGLVQVFTGSAPVAVGTFTSRDHFAGFLEMVLPFTFLCGLALFKSKPGRQLRIGSAASACVLWGAMVIIFLGIAYSLSRMGFLVVLVEVLIVGVSSLATRLHSRWRWVTIAAFTAVLLAGCILLTPDKLTARFASASADENSPGAKGAETPRQPAKELASPLGGALDTIPVLRVFGKNELRLAIWKDTLPLLSEFPVFGCGMGGYESVFLKHQSGDNEHAVEFAHNDYLQFLAELGLLGFAFLAGAIGTIGWMIVRAVRTERDENRRLVLWAVIAGLGGMLLHSAADFNMYIPANAMTFAWIAGLGAAIATGRLSHRRSTPSR